MEEVLCVIETVWTESTPDEQELWMDLEPKSRNSIKIVKVIPVYNLPHSDRENGQIETHYHIDSRFLHTRDFPGNYPIRINLPLKENQKLEVRELVKWTETERIITPVRFISKSKLRHKCIHKGKCPHKGFDLSNEKPDSEGIITCPLHGLKFNTNNKNQIINHE